MLVVVEVQRGVQRIVSPGSVAGGEGEDGWGHQAACDQQWASPSPSSQAPMLMRELSIAPHLEQPMKLTESTCGRCDGDSTYNKIADTGNE